MNTEFLKQLILLSKDEAKNGKVATYIPELATVNPDLLGVCIRTKDGILCAGDAHEKFTIQSISKPLVLLLALIENGEDVFFSKVGKEPTGDSFNSIIRLETYDKQKPYNPMINAGAIATVELIKEEEGIESIDKILNLIRKMAHNPKIGINQEVYLSEKQTGDRNRSIAHFLKAIGNIKSDPEKVLDLYFKQCSIEVTCHDLANIAMVLALDGKSYETGEQLIPKKYIHIAKAYMMTCGMYDGSGEFAIDIGIPAKSGVGGGIMATVKGQMGIGVYGPALNSKGNSTAGLKILKELAEEYDLSIL